MENQASLGIEPKIKLRLTYVDTGDAFEFAMSLDESRANPTENLLDASSGQFDLWGHDLLVFSCGRARTIIVRVTSFELAHLLKSIITQAASTLLCGRIRRSTAHSRIILRDCGSI